MKVFVYGSLLSGLHNHCLLSGSSFVGQGLTKPEYTMYSLGGFPGVVDEGGTAIRGEVYEVDKDVEISLDCLEGVNHAHPESGLYRRAQIELQDGTEVIIYLYNTNYRDKDRLRQVDDGDWRRFCKENKGRNRLG